MARRSRCASTSRNCEKVTASGRNAFSTFILLRSAVSASSPGTGPAAGGAAAMADSMRSITAGETHSKFQQYEWPDILR